MASKIQKTLNAIVMTELVLSEIEQTFDLKTLFRLNDTQDRWMKLIRAAVFAGAQIGLDATSIIPAETKVLSQSSKTTKRAKPRK
jgi:hypothetical protein